MAGTAAVTAKKALVDALAAQTGPGLPLEKIQVAYGNPGKYMQRECIFFGRVRIDQTLSTFASPSVGGGRQPRTEIATLSVYVAVRKIKSDVYAAELRAAELGTVLEELLAGDPTGGGQVLVQTVESGDIESSFDDEGADAVLTYSVTVRSELV
ncbi:hypothetical protein [Amycolatopsis eburnea]|uniref:DUF3168 domain-containing protein n=1 Tax=Amycolatopsis eburnea TaxID=2267691 RepID=A0A427TPQ4_9PSEU|nr:hypothetical protein [Amycolatopsis eburnea]RSD26349.1 hypothetical protein EIY87_00360 [Amycolatopsis eburnea]